MASEGVYKIDLLSELNIQALQVEAGAHLGVNALWGLN